MVVKPKILTYNGNDVKCLRIFPYGSSQEEVAWSKYMVIEGHKGISTTSPSITLYKANISPRTNYSEPNPWIARAGGSGDNWYNGVAYWGDSLTLTLGSASTGKWPKVTTELWYAPTDDVPVEVYSTSSIIKSGNTYTYVIDNVTYNYNVIKFYTSETTIYGSVTGTAGIGFLEHSSSGVGFSSTYYFDATTGVANIGYSKPTATTTTEYGDIIYMYARAYSSDATYGTVPSGGNDLGTYGSYHYYYIGAYNRQDASSYDFGRATLGTDYSTTATKSAVSTSTTKTISLSTLGISSFTSGHKLRFYQATLACNSSNVAFTSPLSYGTSATITTSGTVQTGYASLYWNGTTGFTLSVYGPSGTRVTATVSFKELLHTPS